MYHTGKQEQGYGVSTTLGSINRVMGMYHTSKHNVPHWQTGTGLWGMYHTGKHKQGYGYVPHQQGQCTTLANMNRVMGYVPHWEA